MAKTEWVKTITLAVGRDAALPESGDYILRDLKYSTSGLGLRIYASGGKVWICYKKVHGKPRKIVLGDFPEMTSTQAQTKAASVSATVKNGEDPDLNKKKLKKEVAAERLKLELTVAVAFSEYEADGKDDKPRTVADREAARVRLSKGKLWSMPVMELSGADLHAEYIRLKSAAKAGSAKGATQAGKLMRYVRAAVNHAITKRELLIPDPFMRLNKLEPGWYKTQGRTRIVAATEKDLPAWWASVEALRHRRRGVKDADAIADYLILSLLWGCRKSELLPLTWDKVNLSTRVVVFSDTKSHRDLPIPFGDYANDILCRRYKDRDVSSPKERVKAQYVFPSSRPRADGTWGPLLDPKKSIAAVAKTSVPFSPHDLRRTFASLMDDSGLVSTVALEKVLNHAPSSVLGKHYLVKRLHRQRELYKNYEMYVLSEAGVL
jgi:integrase